jgi:hypothetical protein
MTLNRRARREHSTGRLAVAVSRNTGSGRAKSIAGSGSRNAPTPAAPEVRNATASFDLLWLVDSAGPEPGRPGPIGALSPRRAGGSGDPRSSLGGQDGSKSRDRNKLDRYPAQSTTCLDRTSTNPFMTGTAIASSFLCWAIVHDRQKQATHCIETPSWPGGGSVPQATAVGGCGVVRTHLDGLTEIREFTRRREPQSISRRRAGGAAILWRRFRNSSRDVGWLLGCRFFVRLLRWVRLVSCRHAWALPRPLCV